MPDRGFVVSFPAEARKEHSFQASRAALRANQPPNERVLTAASPSLKILGCQLAAHLYLILRLITRGAINPLPPYAPMVRTGTLPYVYAR